MSLSWLFLCSLTVRDSSEWVVVRQEKDTVTLNTVYFQLMNLLAASLSPLKGNREQNKTYSPENTEMWKPPKHKTALTF